MNVMNSHYIESKLCVLLTKSKIVKKFSCGEVSDRKTACDYVHLLTTSGQPLQMTYFEKIKVDL
jgi:hypothetical protein